MGNVCPCPGNGKKGGPEGSVHMHNDTATVNTHAMPVSHGDVQFRLPPHDNSMPPVGNPMLQPQQQDDPSRPLPVVPPKRELCGRGFPGGV